MPRAVPAETDILCESCGYTLNGLDDSSRCPECGRPIAESTDPSHRGLTGFEQRPGASSFIATTFAILVRPKKFYRALVTRATHPAAEWFARRHRLIAAFGFTSAALGYALWIETMMRRSRIGAGGGMGIATLYLVASVAVYYFMAWLTRFAAWLSSWEGAFWGMRLPQKVVLRCLRYHTACYLPIAIVANVIVWGYWLLLETGAVSRTTGEYFAYTLSTAVVLCAGYLFQMYLIAMRGTRYANR